MKSYKNIVYSEINGEKLTLDLHIPESENFSLFIYFHGGGLEAGDKNDADIFAPILAENNMATASANYRMYPSAKYPEFIEDAAECVSFLKKEIEKYGKCDKFYLGGTSAGGYISMMLCFDGRYLAKHGINPTDIAAYIHDAGQPTSHFNVLRERGIDSRRVIVDESAPLYYVCEKEYSPMLFIVSENDLKNRYEQTELMMSTMRHFGAGDKISYKYMKGYSHCGYVGKRDENGESIFGRIIADYTTNMQ